MNSGQIYRALNQVMSKLGSIGKGQTNQNDGYAFRGIDDFYNAVHKPLVDAGVFSIPRVVDREETVYQDKSNNRLIRVVLKVEYDFTAIDGSKVTVGPVYAEGNDVSDKATNKALSSAHKYAMLQLFCVPTKDIAESDRTTIKIGSEMFKQNFNPSQREIDYIKHPGLVRITWGDKRTIKEHDRQEIVEMIKQMDSSQKERTSEVQFIYDSMKKWLAGFE